MRASGLKFVVKLRDGDKAGVKAAPRTPFVGAIQNDRPQINLGQGIRADEIEIITDVLAGMVKIGHVDDGDLGCAEDPWPQEKDGR